MLFGMLRRINQPAEVCVGKDSLNRLQALPSARALVLSGASAESNGTLERIREQLTVAGALFQIQVKKSQEPTAEEVSELCSRAATFKPDWIVAVGGGSILDTAKFVWANYEYPDLAFEPGVSIEIPPLRRKSRLAAIPTTAGSGSEASQAAVLTDRPTGRKRPYVSPEWIPDLVILDPTAVVSLSPELTACTGMDALAHAAEAYVSRLTNPLVQSLCSAAARLVLRWLPISYSDPKNLEARENMLVAAYLGGLGQSSASTGLAHSLAHASSAVLHIPHAFGTGFFLRSVMDYNAGKSPQLYSRLAEEIGLPGEPDLLAAVEQLTVKINIPQLFSELTKPLPGEKSLNDIARLAVEDVCARTNPVRAEAVDLYRLLCKVMAVNCHDFAN